MRFDYKDVIDFSKLKVCIAEKRTTIKYTAEACGLAASQLSQIIRNISTPLTDVTAKIAWALKVPVSAIVDFKGIEPNPSQKKWFEDHKIKYEIPANATGELTYAPLWELIEGFLTDVNKGKSDGLKTANDIFDTVEPPRKRIGANDVGVEKALEARGFSGKEELKTRKRETKGLSVLNRTKLKNDRGMSMRTIYEICKKLGCSVDWVLSYK